MCFAIDASLLEHWDSQPIIPTLFVAHPFHIETVFKLIKLLHLLWSFVDSPSDEDLYLYLARGSPEAFARSLSSLGRS